MYANNESLSNTLGRVKFFKTDHFCNFQSKLLNVLQKCQVFFGQKKCKIEIIEIALDQILCVCVF